MRRHLIAALIVALALPVAADAKGPLAATVTGPGLGRPLTLTGGGHTGTAGTLGRVAEHAGFFDAAGSRWGPPLKRQPESTLGPRYTVTYDLGPGEEIRQDVYPYADPRPLSYTAPGQRFYGTTKTRGGWYVSRAELKAVLVEAGLPPAAPGGGAGGRWTLDGSWWPLGAAVLVVIALACASGVAVLRRHAARPAPG